VGKIANFLICARDEIACGDLFRVLLPKAFIPLRVMGHFSLSAYESFASTAAKLKCPPDFVRKAFVRGMRFELNLILNILGHLLAVWLPVLMENDRDGVCNACATKLINF
jgi:hypothetical protein